MRRLIFVAALVPFAAYAQPPQQPITLTPQEYQAVLSEVAARDPILRLLMQKQQAAQDAAAATAKPVETPSK